MGRQKLASIKTLDPKIVPPKGAKAVGQLDDGTIIWEMMETEFDRIPATRGGEQVYKKHPTTGESIYPIFRNVEKQTKKRFVLVGTGAGCVFKNFDFEESPEERERQARKKQIEQTNRELATALVDEGISVTDLVSRLKGAAAEPGGDVVYPIKKNAGWWELSNGEKVRGTEAEANEAEAALNIDPAA